MRQCTERRTVSISSTVLNAFSEIPEIGARKFPAAPAVHIVQPLVNRRCKSRGRTADNKVDLPELFDSLRDRLLESRRLPHVGLYRQALLSCRSLQFLRRLLQSVESIHRSMLAN